MAQKKYISLSSLQTFLNNLKSTFATLTHKHTIADMTDYTVDTELSSTSTNPVQNQVLNAEFEAIAATMSSLESAINDKPSNSHAHTVSNISDLTATATELNYMDGVTANVQEQLDEKPDISDLGFLRRVTCTSSDGVTYTGTTDGITALTAGLTIVFISSKTSSSTTPTLNINSLGAKSIKRRLSHLSTSTQAGYSTTWLFANKPYLLVYDGTQWIVDGLTKPSAADLYGTLPIEKGGTGATTAAEALENLGVVEAVLAALPTWTGGSY